MATSKIVDRTRVNVAPFMLDVVYDLRAKGYDTATASGVKASESQFSTQVKQRTIGVLKDRSQNRMLHLLRSTGFRSASYIADIRFGESTNLTIEVYGERNKREMEDFAQQIESKHKLNVKILVTESRERKEWHPMTDDF